MAGFTTRERCELWAAAVWVISGHVLLCALFAGIASLALVSAPVCAAGLAAHVLFADLPPEPDLGPPSGMTPEEIDRQVATTVRHELAHHLGEMSERRLRELGL